jgi:hypothetical protein
MKLRTLGLKAFDQTIDLDRLLLLSAPNGSGKSTIADALRFLALGYVPSLGKRLQDTSSLLRDQAMAVALSLDDGRILSRSLEATPSGFRSRAECSWLARATSQDHGAEILRLFGREELDVAECLDIRQLLNATPGRREERIAALLASGARPPEEKAKAVLRAAVQRLARNARDPDPEEPPALLPVAQEVALREAGDALKARIRTSGLAAALSWVNEEKRRAVREQARKAEAHAEIEARLAAVPSKDVERLRSLEAERGRLERELGALEERALALRRRQARRAQAEREFEEARGALGAEATGASAELTEVERKIDALGLPPFENAVDLRRRAQALEEEARALAVPPAPDPARLEKEFRELEAAEERLRASPWREVGEIGERLTELAGREKSFAMYRVLTDAARLTQLSEAALREDRELLRARLAEQGRERAAAARAREARRKRDARLDEARELRERAERLFFEARTAYAETRRALLARRDELRQAVARAARARAAFDVRRKILESLEVEEPGDERRARALHARLHEVRRTLSDLAGVQRSLVERDCLAEEIGRLEAAREVGSALEWALQRVREEEITEAGSPLVRKMESFLRAAGRPETPYVYAGGGSCRIGWRTPAGKEVPVQAMSGGEWALFTAALAATVTVLRAAPLRILLVEAGEADEKTLRSLLAGIRSVAEDLTCALVLTPRDVQAKGWTVLQRPAPSVAQSA